MAAIADLYKLLRIDVGFLDTLFGPRQPTPTTEQPGITQALPKSGTIGSLASGASTRVFFHDRQGTIDPQNLYRIASLQVVNNDASNDITCNPDGQIDRGARLASAGGRNTFSGEMDAFEVINNGTTTSAANSVVWYALLIPRRGN